MTFKMRNNKIIPMYTNVNDFIQNNFMEKEEMICLESLW